MYGADATNELQNTHLDVTAVPSALPGIGSKSVVTSGPNQGKPFNPGHALIVVETGTVRVRCDGFDPVPGFGFLYGVGTAAGPVIDWTSALTDYEGMIRLFRVVRENSGTPARLCISFRN